MVLCQVCTSEPLQQGFNVIRTCSINGQWGLMGINNFPLILMEINGDFYKSPLISMVTTPPMYYSFPFKFPLISIKINETLLIPINPHCLLIEQVLCNGRTISLLH